MIADSPHQYLRIGLQEGRDRELLRRAIAEASHAESLGLTSVLTLKHLAWQSGASYSYLRKIVQRQIDPYTEIRRRRRNGAEMRRISAPDPPLMSVQRWLLRRIVHKMAVHPASCAYMPGNSVLLCARRHVGASWLIKMDVHNFFHSIDERKIFHIFHKSGYNRLISLELARICTRGGLGPSLNGTALRRYEISSYRSLRLGALPQGGPTSGPLANVAMYDCDTELNTLAMNYGLIYSRYADDITFSAGGDFDRRRANEVVTLAGETLRKRGLTPHKNKTKISSPGSRRIVLGLLVDGDSVRLSKEVRHRIETHIRGVRHFGLKEHSRHRHFASVFSFVHHVNGLLAFAYDIDPEYARYRYEEWNNAVHSRGWPTSRGH
jgi:RNA-directed DNA polymerase